jgi:hypothetical protein
MTTVAATSKIAVLDAAMRAAAALAHRRIGRGHHSASER